MIRVECVQKVSDGLYLHCFQRKKGSAPATTLMIGDRVVVSGEADSTLLGLAIGYVQQVNGSKISCLLDR